jgi:glutathione S-transferase
MTRMRLHWSPKSPFVRKVMICAHELGVAQHLDLVRSVAAMRAPNPDLMLDNPLSKIPTLVLADGSVLYDSLVICEYLNDLAQGPLFPASGVRRWQALRWQALGNGLLDALILWRNEREREQPDRVLLAAFEAKLWACLAALEREVPDLRRSALCIGQIALGCALGYLDYRFSAIDWRARAPALAAWNHEIGLRPSFAATEARDG